MPERDYVIVSDSSCDLPNKVAQELDIKIVPFYVSFGNENYLKERVDIEVSDFYKEMVENPDKFPKTSTPSVQDYVDVFEDIAKQGKDIICICISTKFSASYQTALNAKRIVEEDHPDVKITCINSMVNTVLQGLVTLEAAEMRKNGISYEETINKIESIKATGRIFFTIGSLDYLRHGGRIGKLVGVTGSLLGIKPVITLKEGEIFPSGVARTRAKAVKKVIDIMLEHLQALNANINEYRVVIGYCFDRTEAVRFREELLEQMKIQFPISNVDIYRIGATIGVHTGPHALGIGILKKSTI